jgi:hypothetical protein
MVKPVSPIADKDAGDYSGSSACLTYRSRKPISVGGVYCLCGRLHSRRLIGEQRPARRFIFAFLLGCSPIQYWIGWDFQYTVNIYASLSESLC